MLGFFLDKAKLSQSSHKYLRGLTVSWRPFSSLETIQDSNDPELEHFKCLQCFKDDTELRPSPFHAETSTLRSEGSERGFSYYVALWVA